jgi:hypothetical protein
VGIGEIYGNIMNGPHKDRCGKEKLDGLETVRLLAGM